MNIRQRFPTFQSLKQKSSSSKMALAALSLITAVAGCRDVDLPFEGEANAQALPSPTPTDTLAPTATASPTATFTATPRPSLTPTATPWPSPTPWPTATPWSTPAAWQPAPATLPTLAPLPILPTQAAINGSSPAGLLPVSYAPPDGVDVFGSTVLRWEYYGQLAPDEFFDIKIKPLGSNDSIFVEWSKTNEYELHPWSGWSPGLYTWQIGIVRGYLEGDTKHFMADTGRDSEPFIIKWQAVGSGGGGGGGGNGGGGSSGGS